MNERPTSCASTRGRAGSPSSENHVVPEEERFYDVFDSFSLSDGNEEVWKDLDDAVYWEWDCEVIGESHLEEVELSSMGNLQSDRNRGKNPLKVKSKSPAKSTKQEYVGREKDYKSGGKEPGGGGGGGGAVEPTSVLVTDSWRHVREIQERGPAAVPSSAPSDDSSSPDELYVEPAEMASGDQGTSEPFVTTVGPNFTIVKHRKADLGPTLTDTCLTGILSGKDEDLVSSHTLSVPSSQRRFSSQNETQLESNVLRKVASLTLDRATIDKQTSKPKFTPPKLDFQLYEKFEGGMLVNWLGSSLGEELKQVTDWKQILGRLCCHLLSVGVIRQVTDKDTPPNTQFRTDLMYYWAHNESAGPICPPTPGRLSKLSWPPSEPSTPVTSSIRISTDNLSSRKDLDQISISSDMKELAKINQEQKCLIGDLQTQLDKHNHEKERLKTLADIQALNNKMQLEFSVEDKCVQTDESLIEKLDSSRTTFLNPSTVEKYVQTCDTCKNCRLMSTQTSFEDKLSSLNSLDSYKSAMESLNLPNVTDDVKFSSLAMSKSESSIASSNKNLNHNESVVKCSQNTLTQIKEIDRGTEETNSGHEDVTKISNGEISHKVSNGIAEIQIHRAEEAASGRISEAATPLPKSEDVTSQSSCPPPSPGKSPGPPPMPGGTEDSQIKKETTDKTKSSPRPPKSPSSEPPPLVPETCLPPPTPPVPEIGLPPPPPPMPEMGPPPPPLPEMGPSPPPMPGMGPPPPPMPGMGPPPPPMPGMGPPPPPMPGMSPPPPPPPPMAGIGFAPALPGSGPLPPPVPGGPPPPPMPGMGPAPPPLPGMGPPPPPPPGVGIATGVPPPPPSSSPVPFPSPPIGGWNAERSTFRKQPLVPPVPMKPLYWTRVVVPFTIDEPDFSTEKNCKTALWSELEEASITDLEEFTSLFSRQVVDRKNTKKKVTKPTKAQVLKVLDSKRSQNVGILSTSLHLDFSEIENSVYNFDTSVVSLESLQQIYEVRATEEEVMLIKEQQMLHPDQMLDKPEQFLLELAEIPHFAERIACFMFQAQFTDNITGIESKLNNLKSTCHTLVTSDRLKSVFAIILALGNFMNGGNRQRGQADGFGLEILSKLKDVKSKDNSITLLHYIVKSYIKNCGDKSMSDLLLPVPEPGDVERASTVSFEAVQSQIGQLQNDLNDCIKKVKLVTEAAVSENVETFKNKMDAFVSKAETNLKDETENLDECRQKFVSLLKFYQFHAPGGKLNEVEPKEFFSLWTPFCSDFKDLWKKEEHLRKAKLKETLKKQKEIKRGVQKVKIGGFKSTLLKFEEEITNVKN